MMESHVSAATDQYASLVTHYATMASNPAFVDQARHSVAKLMRDHPEEFEELANDVKREIDARSKD